MPASRTRAYIPPFDDDEEDISTAEAQRLIKETREAMARYKAPASPKPTPRPKAKKTPPPTPRIVPPPEDDLGEDITTAEAEKIARETRKAIARPKSKVTPKQEPKVEVPTITVWEDRETGKTYSTESEAKTAVEARLAKKPPMFKSVYGPLTQEQWDYYENLGWDPNTGKYVKSEWVDSRTGKKYASQEEAATAIRTRIDAEIAALPPEKKPLIIPPVKTPGWSAEVASIKSRVPSEMRAYEPPGFWEHLKAGPKHWWSWLTSEPSAKEQYKEFARALVGKGYIPMGRIAEQITVAPLSLIPGTTTAAYWAYMTPWEKAASVGLDLAAVGTMVVGGGVARVLRPKFKVPGFVKGSLEVVKRKGKIFLVDQRGSVSLLGTPKELGLVKAPTKVSVKVRTVGPKELGMSEAEYSRFLKKRVYEVSGKPPPKPQKTSEAEWARLWKSKAPVKAGEPIRVRPTEKPFIPKATKATPQMETWYQEMLKKRGLGKYKPSAKPPPKPRVSRRPLPTPIIRAVTDPLTGSRVEIRTIIRTDPVTQARVETVTKTATNPITKVVTKTATETKTDPATKAETETVTRTITNPITRTKTKTVTRTITDPTTGKKTITRTTPKARTTPRVGPRKPRPTRPRFMPRFPRGSRPDTIVVEGRVIPKKGAVAWRQGILYIVMFPPYGRSNTIWTDEPPIGIRMFKGPDSAYKSITRLGGKLPGDLKLELGIFSVGIIKREGKQPRLKYSRLKGVRV